jgi:hypothetical protein
MPTVALRESCIGDDAFVEYFRCPEQFAAFGTAGRLARESGYFRFGPDLVCYGRSAAPYHAVRPTDELHDVMSDVSSDGSSITLPFRPSEIVSDLRQERYMPGTGAMPFAIAKAYYAVRPFLGVRVRKQIQRARLRGWQNITFPNWPVDRRVERIFESLLVLALKTHAVEKIPFVWFWPDGFEHCVVMTHDVETSSGRDFVHQLMDIDEAHHIKSSFQIVPEGRYQVTEAFLASIRARGFEINIHDLNHDGRLFMNRERFLSRVERINAYGRLYGVEGFRSAIMYRNLEWMSALDFRYDMSVPTVGHLEAQRGGCCSIMPFYNGQILELPLTTTQDYSLFNILKQHSIDLWQRQIAEITSHHGLVTLIVHPDYVAEKPEQETYKSLLTHINEVRSQGKSWMALPGEGWRDRRLMTLVQHGDEWRVEGPQSHRARVGYASLGEDGVVYRLHGAVLSLSTEEPAVSLVAAAMLGWSVVRFAVESLLPRIRFQRSQTNPRVEPRICAAVAGS